MRNKLCILAIASILTISIFGCKSEKSDIPEEEKQRIESIDTDNAMKEADRILKEIDKL